VLQSGRQRFGADEHREYWFGKVRIGNVTQSAACKSTPRKFMPFHNVV
jgi:hypothetical protein